MQAVILAAGMGRRLGRLTGDRTKGMVEVHGRTLLHRSMDALVEHGVERIVLVVGHRADGVREAVGTEHRGVPVHYVDNPDYATTNNIHSLHLAAAELVSDDTLLLESDLIYDARIIERLVNHPAPDVVAVAARESWMNGTMVTLGPDRQIESFVPAHRVDPRSAEDLYKTVNIYKFSRRFLEDQYLPFLQAYVRSVGVNEYYEQVLRVIAGLDHGGLVGMPVDERWYEIDDLQDYRIAETLFAPHEERYEYFLRRHGGFWRFPQVLDYCYLVNPWFPTEAMYEDFGRSMRHLLADYPSSLQVQAQLAAEMFDGDPACFTVGNGAAELIATLGEVLDAGRVGVTVPTFEEYLKRFPHAQVVTKEAGGADFETGFDHHAELLARVDALVLVNPENPTGRCLTAEEVVALLELAEETGKRIVLDESFVDFTDPTHCTSLLRQGVLDDHPSLVVLKSISKSYGVPGARLGVMATRDADLLGRVVERLPVWNINSMGEHFLQVIGRHRGEYVDACAELRAERERFAKALDDIRDLHVVPSQANYLLCRLPDGVSSRSVVTRLLNEHDILVKDCGGKPGFGDGAAYVRIAVRDEVDNEVMIGALRGVLASVR
ncbi:aminotransferase class I/II-fold pyridoxal phosphate-dependent enzyme [Nocardioides panacisoli]|uniref:aminotransferase class I/II-fold pyridoxal phosphate-dependent enzyme n=1 Tax=Nocardioides panacisoli TaxID=627624 RepID=UPI001C63A9A5|nr:aminotransferase class I/II-fold pyridoxal phosphate-dependent enzyme [Nocardioides panacisoli]QYJ04203.1 aminotransferase class I/II-fold pyridoxal phosphate-dependent enzyme [Nocardioides panacisoli]